LLAGPSALPWLPNNMTVLSDDQERDGPAADSEHNNNRRDLEDQDVLPHQDGLDQFAEADPELERRVVRKIDLHLVPLVMALCRYCLRQTWRLLTIGERSVSIFGPFKHRVRVHNLP